MEFALTVLPLLAFLTCPLDDALLRRRDAQDGMQHTAHDRWADR